MDNTITTDDDRQTSSNGQSSSDDISSKVAENLLPVRENTQQRMSNMSIVRVYPVKVNSRNSLPNLKIKHPYRPDNNENDSFNEEKRPIIDEHVKVSHIKRSSLLCVNTEISLLRLDACSRRKSTGNVSVSRANKRISQNENENPIDRRSVQMASRQSIINVSRTPTITNIHQDSHQKPVASKPMVKRVSISTELPFQMNQKELHVSIKHASVNPKKSP